MMGLTAKQQRFVDEYLIDLNATESCIRAGYKVSKRKSAMEIGSQLLKNYQVSAEIEKKMAERSRRTGITQDRVLQELARIGFLNPVDVIDTNDATVLPNASKDDLACIQSVKVKTMETDKGSSEEREVKFNDKLKALDLLGRHLGMWNDKVQIDANVTPVFHEDLTE